MGGDGFEGFEGKEGGSRAAINWGGLTASEMLRLVNDAGAGEVGAAADADTLGCALGELAGGVICWEGGGRGEGDEGEEEESGGGGETHGNDWVVKWVEKGYKVL